jgi:hypothetical protein
MYETYARCSNLTGAPVCGNNVTNMGYTYFNCRNLSGNAYFYSEHIANITACFSNRANSKQLNIYVKKDSLTENTIFTSTGWNSIIGESISWGKTDSCHYNTKFNLYIYSVDSVKQANLENEFDNLINPSEVGENAIINNNLVAVKTKWIYPTSPVSIDSGSAYVMSVNLNELESVNVENVEVR